MESILKFIFPDCWGKWQRKTPKAGDWAILNGNDGHQTRTTRGSVAVNSPGVKSRVWMHSLRP